MSYKRKNRGSILIMVVGMLTVLFMLGLTFLAVCHMNAKQAEATAATSQVEPVSDDIVAMVRKTLRNSRYINQTNGPYGSLGSSGSPSWVNYVVYPASDVTPWLSGGAYVSQSFGTVSGLTMTDTNGDGINDAYLFDSQVRNNNGDIYYAAVRIEDLSGRLNVNVAGDGTAITPVNYPSAVNIRDYIGNAPYGNLMSNRSPSTANISLYSLNCARRLLSPNPPNPTSFRPFAIGDEAYLRWLKPVPNMTTNGRLYNILGAGNRANLTTFNCSPGIPRDPSKSFPAKTYVKGYVSTTDASTALDTLEARQRLYDQLKTIWPSGSNDDKRKIAHFVANLWAYLDRQVDASGSFKPKAYKFQPKTGVGNSLEDWYVYGVIEQPIISEVFAYYLPQSSASGDPDSNDQAWAVAVEIMNPTTHEITMHDTAGVPLYRVKCGSGEYSLDKDAGGTDKLTLKAGERIVLYTFGGKRPTDPPTRVNPAVEADFGFKVSGTINPRWLKMTGATPVLEEFAAAVPVELRRTADGEDILMDKVFGSDIQFNVTGITTNKAVASTTCCDGRRDDDTGRNRAMVGSALGMKVNTTAAPQSGPNGHALNEAKGLDAVADLPGVLQGFSITLENTTPTNLGNLSNVYLAGPYKDTAASTESDLPHDLALVAGDVSRGRLDFRGTVNGVGGTYPDIPKGLLVEEFLTGNEADNTRNDEPGLATRHYGKINVNTATKEVLAQMFPASLTAPRKVGGVDVTFSGATAAEYIFAYREKMSYGGKDYLNRATATGLTDLRAGSNSKGYLSTSELAIPLADYADARMAALGITDYTKLDGYLEARNYLYQCISNLVTVNSDVFAATIRVELWKNGVTPSSSNDTPTNHLYTWNYLAVIDRSNVTFSREGGTVTSAGANTLTDSGKNWTAGVWVGQQVQIASGTGVGQIRTISGSTANMLTVSAAWEISPDTTSKYCIVYSPTIFPQPAVLMFTKLTD